MRYLLKTLLSNRKRKFLSLTATLVDGKTVPVGAPTELFPPITLPRVAALCVLSPSYANVKRRFVLQYLIISAELTIVRNIPVGAPTGFCFANKNSFSTVWEEGLRPILLFFSIKVIQYTAVVISFNSVRDFVMTHLIYRISMLVFLCLLLGCKQQIEGQPPLDITWRESRLDKATGGFAIIKGQPATQSYVLQIANKGTDPISKIRVTVKSSTGETEGWEIPKLESDKYEELGKLETNGRGFVIGDEITVWVPNYTLQKTITLQQTQTASIDGEPPLDITWRSSRLDAGHSYVLQLAISPSAKTTIPKVTVSVKSAKGETELYNVTLGKDGRIELGRAETKGRGFHKNDVITLTVPGYQKSKIITVQEPDK